MKTLHLTLKKEWFDRHLKDKQEEYRAITPYWIVRLYEWVDGMRITMKGAEKMLTDFHEGIIPFGVVPIQYNIAEAKNGYDDVPMFRKEFIETIIGIGNPDWGAPEHPVFIIKLGKRISQTKRINR